MCITAQAVRDTSLTGEFDALSDAQIGKFVTEVCPLYGTVIKKNVKAWQEMVALHVAHNLHEALLMEGQGGAPGPVQSESFAQVGSRSFAVGNAPDGGDWWKNSSYGRRWHKHWIAIPYTFTAIPT